MTAFANDFISLLQFLIPGFLTAWVFYGLTPHPKPAQFERVIEALIFTLIVQAFVLSTTFFFGVGDAPWFDATDFNAVHLPISLVLAVVLGLLLAVGANHDFFHRFCRRIGISRQTSYPSEWFGAFNEHLTYVVLHLKDERRIYGWPVDWPSDPEKGHFRS